MYAVRRLAVLLALALGTALALAQDLQPLPELKSPVTDLTGTLTAQQIAALEQRLLAFEARKGSQIVVVLVPTTEPEPIEDYTIRLAERAKVGRKGLDDGVIVLVAMRDRRTRIEVGYGLEGVIPDSVANRIRREVMNPYFRDGRFYEGLIAGTDALAKLIESEKLPAPAQRKAPPGEGGHEGGLEGVFVIGLVLVVVFGSILRRIFGRFLGSAAVGGLTGSAAWLITGLALVGTIAAILAFIFSLMLAGTAGRRLRQGSGYFPGGWSSGGWAGGASRSGGWSGGGLGGGWSGGGGGFGGGGASGSWND